MLAGLILLGGCRYLTIEERSFVKNTYKPAAGYSHSFNVNRVRVVKNGLAWKAAIRAAKFRVRSEAITRSQETVSATPDEINRFIESLPGSRSSAGSAFVVGNTVFMSGQAYAVNFRDGWPPVVNCRLPLFGHELVHVWQHQNRALTGYSLRRVISEHLRYGSRVYDYKIEPGKGFLDYRFEQQGRIMEDFIRLKTGCETNPGKLKKLQPIVSGVFDEELLKGAVGALIRTSS